ncbi:MAG: cupin domain-containing protein [Psychrosphaera sp.]|nr:cupin domain-containing protein [Psychrosphaera sp.]
MKPSNLFNDIPSELPEEVFQDLLSADNVRIERIISKGHSSPESGWYDQDENEWVLVVKGKAKLRFEKDDQLVELNAGDFIDIKAHTKHKVQWTCPDQQTVWLAVFY